MNDNDLANRVLELEKRVAKLEKINKRTLVFKIISLVLSVLFLLVLLYVFYYYYTNLLDFF
jgi:ABC-type bacteriocin/lantibiotic exporter with double-glycine peptidase domain